MQQNAQILEVLKQVSSKWNLLETISIFAVFVRPNGSCSSGFGWWSLTCSQRPHLNLHLSPLTHCQTLLTNTVCELNVRSPRLKTLPIILLTHQKTFNMPGGPSNSSIFPQRASISSRYRHSPGQYHKCAHLFSAPDDWECSALCFSILLRHFGR